MLSMQIREAVPEDIDGILAIYNDEVQNGIATFATEPMSREDGLRWLGEHEGGNRCVYVGVSEEKIVGYAALSRFSWRGGYDRTAELSVYVAKPFRGQGAARRLMETLLARAGADPAIHAIISIITADNIASRNLHEKFGFRHMGRLKEVGRKFGITLDVDYYERLV